MGRLGGWLERARCNRQGTTCLCACRCRLMNVDHHHLACIWNRWREGGPTPLGVQQGAAHNAVHLISQVSWQLL